MLNGVWLGFVVVDTQLSSTHFPAKLPEPGPPRVVPLTVQCSICGATLEYTARLLNYRGYVACGCGNQEPVGHSDVWNPSRPNCPSYDRARSKAVKIDEDEAERKHEQALRAIDPRLKNNAQRPRMRMLRDDSQRTLAELGAEIGHFIDPDDVGGSRKSRHVKNRF